MELVGSSPNSRSIDRAVDATAPNVIGCPVLESPLVSTALDDLVSDPKVNVLAGTPAYAGVDLALMNPATATIPVLVDSALLTELRERSPGKDDQTLLEELARIELGFATLAEVQERSDLGDDEAREIALRAIRESRAESA